MPLVRKTLEWLVVTLTRLCKFILRLVTQKGEIERVLLFRYPSGELGVLSARLVRRVAISLAQSSQLRGVKGIIFGGRPFVVNEALDEIVRIKRLRDSNVVSALRWCLELLSAVNAVHLKVATLQRESYDKTNPEHVALLESLWNSLKPECRRNDWGELGFQNGLVPQSDFRGMGMLGLYQLVYFAQHRNSEAKHVLSQSCNTQRYFPFAAAGINVTAFTLRMLEQRRLDPLLYEVLAKLMLPGRVSSCPSQDALALAGLSFFNDFYCQQYVEFSRYWHDSLPEDSMAFPAIFGIVKQRSQRRHPRLAEEYWG